MSEELFQEARAAHHGGEPERAEQLYARVLAEDPGHFRALHNLGALREAAGLLDEAEALYARAIEAGPAEARPRFNLACMRHLRGDLGAAERLYREAIVRDPKLAGAHFNLGRLLQERGDALAAEGAVRAAMQHGEAGLAQHRLLGDALFSQGRLMEALISYDRTADLEPDTATSHFDLGKVLESMAKGEESLHCYRQAMELEPRSDAAREAVVRVLGRLGRTDEAMTILERWRSEEPGRGYAEHLIASMGGAPAAERAPDGYVSALFDRFAAGFDATLNRLDYRAPELVRDAVAAHLGEPLGALTVLDAGCGTGLCAPLIRPWASRLDGVDLSAGMVERARARGGYDSLIVGELVSFLHSRPAGYDAVVSADTFCYLGPLAAAARAAHVALRPGGLLVFTVERGESQEPRLGEHGRYRHSEAHVRAALLAAAFKPAQVTHGTLRREGGEPVEGLVVAAHRT